MTLNYEVTLRGPQGDIKPTNMLPKKLLYPLLFLVLFTVGCAQTNDSTNTIETTGSEQSEGLPPSSTAIPPLSSLDITVYTAFIINTHDWANPEESIATLNKLIDLHEKHQIPIDIYLNDPVVQIYETQAPDLIERLKTSPYVAISYHLRPPYPYYWDYDWLGLDKLSDSELKTLLLNYEEHEIDLTTGEPTDNPGGYELLKELMRYPPYVTVVMGNQKVQPILAEIYKEKGALFTLTHSGTTEWGETKHDLWMRPESLEIKMYENLKRKSGEEILTQALTELGETRPTFLNLKWHEDNFYTSGTPWGPVYWSDSDERNFLYPPYNLSKAMENVKVKTEIQKQEQWTRYEETLIYVKNHPEIFTPINAKNLTEMVEG